MHRRVPHVVAADRHDERHPGPRRPPEHRDAGQQAVDQRAFAVAAFDTTDRHSVLGTYSIDDVGDTSLNRLAGYRVVNGRPVFTTALTAPP